MQVLDVSFVNVGHHVHESNCYGSFLVHLSDMFRVEINLFLFSFNSFSEFCLVALVRMCRCRWKCGGIFVVKRMQFKWIKKFCTIFPIIRNNSLKAKVVLLVSESELCGPWCDHDVVPYSPKHTRSFFP